MAEGAFAAPAFVLPPPVQVAPLPANSPAQSVSFVRGAFQISEGATWAYEGTSTLTCSLAPSAILLPRPVKWKAADWELESARMASVFREEATRAGFLRGSTVNLFDSGPSGDRYQVAALITAMDGRFCGSYEYRPVPYNGRMRMSVEWQVFDTLARQVVKRVPTEAGGEERKVLEDGIERVFFAAFRENVKALLASEEFRALITSAPGTAPTVTALSPLPFRPAAVAKRPIASAAEAVASVFTGDGLGSGFLISSDGYLLTNHHVVGRAKYVKVRWSDGAETVGEVLRSDARRDVAIIKADPGHRTPLALSETPAGLGEAVFAIGTPLDAKFQGSVTKGVVSATRTYEGLPYIQSDVTINGGNSGGPLIDEAGSVLGMTVSGMDISGAPVGINLFIPIADALKALALTPAS
ncbi:trypsin-like peptidase domain-containing protein [Phenylobacterium sp.]|uniref:S1C family serine protease n=1 Tax=Phenylobacterium sp. TaxID=1871053 RepID=UPI0025F64EBD|nr:trypsin-like peptidase domain-containing protein [Phenylobacterium sp.]